jgi:5'(3')-deoxyribonucleotidase
MKIGIDLDNVVVHTTEALLSYLAERGAPEKRIEDITQYWIENNYPPKYNLLIKEAFESKEMWKKVEFIEESYLYIKWLYEAGHEIYFVTSSLPENLRKKIKHLARNLDFFPTNYVWRHTINIHYKQLLNLDVLVDDCYDHLCGVHNYQSICFNYPWNTAALSNPDIICANDWSEIYHAILIVENEKKEKIKADIIKRK